MTGAIRFAIAPYLGWIPTFAGMTEYGLERQNRATLNAPFLCISFTIRLVTNCIYDKKTYQILIHTLLTNSSLRTGRLEVTVVPTTQDRSIFITVLAWIFIVFAGFTTVISLLQTILISVMLRSDEMQSSMHQTQNYQEMPTYAKFFFDSPQVIFGAFFVVCLLTLISAIGLLRRKNWARIVFIGLMGLGIVWNVVAAVFPIVMMSSFQSLPENTPSDYADSFQTMQNVIMIGSFIFAIAFAVLFGWIIKRLVSAEIRREFLMP